MKHNHEVLPVLEACLAGNIEDLHLQGPHTPPLSNGYRCKSVDYVSKFTTKLGLGTSVTHAGEGMQFNS